MEEITPDLQACTVVNDKSSDSFLCSPGIKPFDEKQVRGGLFLAGVFAIIALFFIIYFLLREAFPFFQQENIFQFLFGNRWLPHADENPQYGAAPIIVGTLLVTLGAVVFSVPLGIACAIYIAELAPPKVRVVLKTAVELLAGIPSVVYGYFGLTVLTRWLRVGFDQPSGDSWLAGSILLGIMALPTIVSVAEDAISAVPREYKEASLALGATRWQTISKVIVPSAISGITAAVILGLGRAIGETMAVMMVTGNTAIYPQPIWNVFSTIRTITGTLGIETREVPIGSTWYHALFALAVVLFVMTFLVNTIANYILKRMNEKFHPKSKEEREQAKNIFRKWWNRRNRHEVHETGGAGEEPKKSRKSKTQSLLKHHQGNIINVIILVFVGFLCVTLFGLVAGLIIVTIAVGVMLITRKLTPAQNQKFAFAFVTVCNLIVLLLLGIIVSNIVSRGIGAISFDFLTDEVKRSGKAGGILPCILGTLYLVGGAILFAVPLGVLAGIYLAEYAKDTRMTRIIRSAMDNLNGTPSIIFGLFGFAFFVGIVFGTFTLLAGQLTLGIMVLPTIIRTTEEAIKTVPQELREGSYAMGTSKWGTIKKVVLPSAKPGIVTGAVLGMGRVAGETAPIIYVAVAFQQRFMPLPDPMRAVQALPYHLFVLSTEVPGPEAAANAGGTALVLFLLVLLFFSLATWLRMKYKKDVLW